MDLYATRRVNKDEATVKVEAVVDAEDFKTVGELIDHLRQAPPDAAIDQTWESSSFGILWTEPATEEDLAKRAAAKAKREAEDRERRRVHYEVLRKEFERT